MAYNNPYYPQYYPQYSQAQNQNGMTWVQGLAGAKSFLVAPNTTVSLWDSEGQTIYIKSADASGMPSMKILDYTIREQNTASPVQASNDYVTKQELSDFESKITEMVRKELGA